MKEFLEIFALANTEDTPLGLNALKSNNRLNQPSLAYQKQHNFAPLFRQTENFLTEDEDGELISEYDCGLRWLNYIKTCE